MDCRILGEQRVQQGGAGAGQADDEDWALDFHLGDPEESHPVEGNAQPARQHAQHLALDRSKPVHPIWPRAIGPFDYLAESLLEPLIGKAIGAGRALGEGQNLVSA